MEYMYDSVQTKRLGAIMKKKKDDAKKTSYQKYGLKKGGQACYKRSRTYSTFNRNMVSIWPWREGFYCTVRKLNLGGCMACIYLFTHPSASSALLILVSSLGGWKIRTSAAWSLGRLGSTASATEKASNIRQNSR